ncbi:RDD family protein [Actinomadura hibisca]|uniref:RDD family protein n=1 Tax=Actinomadura hibisca TaxID=68565 RepID=UPI00082D2130|nr:RDD family protein [Actinomadura hibisca]
MTYGSGTGLRHGPWWRRVVARIIDGIIVAIPTFLIGVVISAIVMGTATGATPIPWVRSGDIEENRPTAQFLINLVGLIIAVAYETFFLQREGATIGKKVMKLRVVPVNGPYVPGMTSRMAVIRALTWYLPSTLSGLAWIGWIFGLFSFLNGLWPLWDRPSRQSLNDKVAHTLVIRT